MAIGFSVRATAPQNAYSAQAFYFRCDRCLERKTGLDFAGLGIAGCYTIHHVLFEYIADEGESILCCECVWADPYYLWLFGKSGCTTVDVLAVS